MALVDTVQQHLGPAEVNQISQQLGVDPAVAQSAISAALPMILGGMARHASQPDGAGAVQQAIGAHGGMADDLASVLQAGSPADGGGIGGLLGSIFGSHGDSVHQGVQQASGLDQDKTRRLLAMLTPIVLGILARHRFGGQSAPQIDPGQLSGTLNQEARAAEKQAPHVGGLLGKILGAVESPRA
jgi:hypothetical protein